MTIPALRVLTPRVPIPPGRGMLHILGSALILSLVLALADAAAQPATPPVPPGPAMEDLGDGRALVGGILVDRHAQIFSLPARVIRLEPPLEFLVVGPPWERAYESLLQTEVLPVAFNLACILIGLEAPPGAAPGFHFDPAELKGPAVRLEVSWQADGEVIRRPAAELLREAQRTAVTSDWVYVGSSFSPDGRFLAAMDGTLVGFVHAPESIIEHRTGLGIGRYGSLAGNGAVAPPVGTPVTLHVTRVVP